MRQQISANLGGLSLGRVLRRLPSPPPRRATARSRLASCSGCYSIHPVACHSSSANAMR